MHTLKGRMKNNNNINKTTVYLIVPNSLKSEYFESRLQCEIKIKLQILQKNKTKSTEHKEEEEDAGKEQT